MCEMCVSMQDLTLVHASDVLAVMHDIGRLPFERYVALSGPEKVTLLMERLRVANTHTSPGCRVCGVVR